MMMMDYEFQDRNNLTLDDIDLSLLRLTSPPHDYYSRSSSSSSTNEISPLKRSSPVSDESDHPKRRKISLQDPIFTISPPLFTSPETHSSSLLDPTRDPTLPAGKTCCSHACSVSEKQETEKQKMMKKKKMVNNGVEEKHREETEKQRAEKEEEEEEEGCGEGMRIERSGDGFVIRLKCKCRLAFRVLFSDHHLYFKPL